MKDNIPTDRVPIVTLLLIAAGLAGCVLWHHDERWLLLADLPFLWIFGPSVEDSMSRVRFVVLCLLGAAAAIGAQAALDPGSALLGAGASGAVAAAIGGYAVLYRRARVVTVVPVPTLVRLYEVPAMVYVAPWLALQALLGGWVGFVAQAAGLAVGLVAIRALAQRRKRLPPPSPPAVAALR